MLEHCYCGHFRHIDFQMSLSAGIQRYLSHPCKTYEQKIDLGVINIVLVLFFYLKIFIYLFLAVLCLCCYLGFL